MSLVLYEVDANKAVTTKDRIGRVEVIISQDGAICRFGIREKGGQRWVSCRAMIIELYWEINCWS